MQVAPSGGQLCSKCCHVVAELILSHRFNFWVRCASDNVSQCGSFPFFKYLSSVAQFEFLFIFKTDPFTFASSFFVGVSLRDIQSFRNFPRYGAVRVSFLRFTEQRRDFCESFFFVLVSFQI